MRRTIAKRANLVLACSREAAQAFGAGPARILPYGVDLAPFTQPHPAMQPHPGLRERLGTPPGARVLGAFGRLTRQKNHTFLLDAFATALRSQPELYLLIAGEGELRSGLEAQILKLGLAGRARLLGLRDDVPALLAGVCNGFAMPSLHEGLPVALLEAQAAGLPCLVSSAISPEATVLGEQVERLALDEPWPERLAALAGKPRLEPALATERMRRAGFDVADAWPRLTALYDAAREARARAKAA
jgi:glycosyltransferase involved in cell wall biosynthesis